MTVLVLTITSYQFQSLGPGAKKEFNQQGGSFGRAGDNEWVLPDPERTISSYHGEISFRDDHYWLTDNSTNGTFVRGGELLGKGNSVMLQHGDLLHFGDYEVRVEINDANLSSNPFIASSRSNLGSSSDEPWHINSPNFNPLTYLDKQFPAAGIANGAAVDDWMNEVQDDHSTPVNNYFVAPSLLRDESIHNDRQAAAVFADSVESSNWKAGPEGVSAIPDAAPKSKPLPGITQNRPSAKTATFAPEHRQKQPSPDSALATTQASDNLLEIFLEAAGLDAQSMTGMGANRADAMAHFGNLFRDMVQGMVELLRARAELESGFRISHTTIRAAENNPLKFMPNADEALRALFIGKQSGFLGSTEAIQEGINNIRNHQIAMIYGMQSAFNALMQQLHPDRFVNDFGNSGVLQTALMALNKKTRAWDNYADFYDRNVRKSGDAFQILFGEEFGRAYEEQCRSLNTPPPTVR